MREELFNDPLAKATSALLPQPVRLYKGRIIGKDAQGNTTGILFTAPEIFAKSESEAAHILLVRAIKDGKVDEKTLYVISVRVVG